MKLLDEILNGEVRAGARLLRWIEDGLDQARPLLKKLYAYTGRAYLVGITGNPGSGKSTLTNELIGSLRRQGKSVAVVAVDPSSPFTGGSILGDRIRMQTHATDDGVFIRSFANRGHMGGLTSTAHEVVHVLDAMGWDVILVETVGVGQDEVEVQRLVQTTVVLLTPGMGDEIQAIKAGILEIADVFVVNKADYPGADRTVKELQAMLEMGQFSADGAARPDQPADWLLDLNKMAPSRIPSKNWIPKIVKTVATSSQGIDDLVAALEQHRAAYLKACEDPAFLRQRLRLEFLEVYRRMLFERGWSYLMKERHLNRVLDQLADRSSDPYTLAEQSVEKLTK